jgi:Asp-tRNA(Asn)/Glu-tRNA(Gln) amidotransferase A subunit family amidase
MGKPLRMLATDLAAESIAAIEAADAAVEAWVRFDRDGALQRAGSCKSGLPLSGVPFGGKDIFDTAELPTEWGSPVYGGRQPEVDAALVAELKRLGAFVLGKTHTTAFAYYDPAPTRNPRNLEHTPGGSSSGSAAAVAASMVPLALGTQTQGSVLRPASFCGVVGFKPSRGSLSVEGVLPCSPTLDTAGLFTSTVDDMRFVWNALRPGGEARSAERIICVPWPPSKRVEPGMAECVQSATARLAQAGLEVQEGEAPASFDMLPQAVAAVMAYEAAQTHHERYEQYGVRLGEKLAELVESGRQVSDASYRDGLQAITTAEKDFLECAGEDAVVATPASMGPAPYGLGSTGDPACNLPWTAIGAAAISVPCGTVDGLPVGLQLTAVVGCDSMLLETADVVERILST